MDGISMERARNLVKGDAKQYGTMMTQLGDADGMVVGAVSTAQINFETMQRRVLQIIKIAPASTLVSSVFFMLLPNQVPKP